MPRVYKKDGEEYKQAVGSKAQVMHGTAHHTSGGCTKAMLFQDPVTKRIKSRAKMAAGKKAYANMDPKTKALFKANAAKNRFKAGATKKAAPQKKPAKTKAKTAKSTAAKKRTKK